MTVKKEKRKPVYLVNQEGIHNKYYNMIDQGDGTMKVTYGAIGSTCNEYGYPIGDWDKKYREKTSTRKGYTDVSDQVLGVGTAVRTTENQMALVIQGRRLGMDRCTVQTERGIQQIFREDELSPAFVDPANIMHAMFYPNLIKLYCKIKGIKKPKVEAASE